MGQKIYEVHISIEGSVPMIWRKLQVINTTSLLDFHKILQTSLGWTNTHLFEFDSGKKIYSGDEDLSSLENTQLCDVLKTENDKLIYNYDFGDFWEHIIFIEKIIDRVSDQFYPQCIDGENECPPEDCGGILRYKQMVKTIANPKNKDYKETIDWLREDFDPKYFNKDEINELLMSEDYGVLDFGL